MSQQHSSTQQLGRSRRTTSCVASQRSSYFPCCFIHVVERSSRNTLTRDLAGSSSATCSASYESELNSVDCTPPGGCRTDLLSKYTGPDMLSHGRQESPQPTHNDGSSSRPLCWAVEGGGSVSWLWRLCWAVGSSGSAHGGDRRRFPLRLKHYSDAGYINLLAPLALLPATTHARRRLRALVIGGGAGEV